MLFLILIGVVFFLIISNQYSLIKKVGNMEYTLDKINQNLQEMKDNNNKLE